MFIVYKHNTSIYNNNKNYSSERLNLDSPHPTRSFGELLKYSSYASTKGLIPKEYFKHTSWLKLRNNTVK
jgi:hypothetical protein